jgi:hypothetical protein
MIDMFLNEAEAHPEFIVIQSQFMRLWPMPAMFF